MGTSTGTPSVEPRPSSDDRKNSAYLKYARMPRFTVSDAIRYARRRRSSFVAEIALPATKSTVVEIRRMDRKRQSHHA